MSIALETGVAADVPIGPVWNSTGTALVNDLTYEDVTLECYVGTDHSTPTLSGTTDADWWLQASGNDDGMYFVRLPAALGASADGMGVRLRGAADGCLPFGNYESLQYVDYTNADKLSAVLDLSDGEVGIASAPDAATVRAAVGLAAADLDTQLGTIDGNVDDIETAVGVIDGVVDAILVDTAEIGAAGAGLTALPWNAAWDAEVQSEVTDALDAYDPPTTAELSAAVSGLSTLDTEDVESAVADALAAYDGPTKAELDAAQTAITNAIGALNDLGAGDILTTALTEAYAEDGAAPTLSEFLFMIWSYLTERSIEGTAMTTKTLDGETAMGFVLNDEDYPTSVSRAS